LCNKFSHLECAGFNPDDDIFLQLHNSKLRYLCERCNGNDKKSIPLLKISNSLVTIAETFDKLQNKINSNFCIDNSESDNESKSSTSYANVAAKNILKTNEKFIHVSKPFSFISKKKIEGQVLHNNNNNNNKNINSNNNCIKNINHSFDFHNKDAKVIVIRGITDYKCKYFHYVREIISNKITNAKLNNSKLCQSNNLFISCYDSYTYNCLLKNDTLLFGALTSPLTMLDFISSNTTNKLLIRGVNKDVETDFISKLIAEQTPTMIDSNGKISVIRLKKENLPTNSILIIANSKEIINHLKINGLTINHIFYMPTDYISQPYIKFCKKCLKYGHTINKCISPLSLCESCGNNKHGTNKCLTDIICLHCKEHDHITGAKICKFYQSQQANLNSSFSQTVYKNDY
jgi:hypothetical protein